MLERGFREGALCIRDPDRRECNVFISMGIAIRRGIVHVTVTRMTDDGPEKSVADTLSPMKSDHKGGNDTHTKSEWQRARKAQSDQLVSESSKGW